MNELAKNISNDLSIKQLDDLINCLKLIINEKYNQKYYLIELCSGNGNISKYITEITGYYSYWEGKESFCGYNYIVIERESISVEQILILINDLKSNEELNIINDKISICN